MVRLLVGQSKDPSKPIEPVLHLERPYPDSLQTEYKTALINFASDCAKDLGVPLIASAPSLGSFNYYPNKVRSLFTKAPSEYIDALAGMRPGQLPIYSEPYNIPHVSYVESSSRSG